MILVVWFALFGLLWFGVFGLACSVCLGWGRGWGWFCFDCSFGGFGLCCLFGLVWLGLVRLGVCLIRCSILFHVS